MKDIHSQRRRWDLDQYTNTGREFVMPCLQVLPGHRYRKVLDVLRHDNDTQPTLNTDQRSVFLRMSRNVVDLKTICV